MKKERVEAITDGIIAIAATIMVLQLGIPKAPTWEAIYNDRLIFVSYIISYFMIYITWHMHHKLFSQIKTISNKAFIANGVWIFFLTLVPFTTLWFGSFPNKFPPSIVYALNLALWSLSFQYLYFIIKKDNPDIKEISSTRLIDRLILIISYGLAIIISFYNPRFILLILGISTFILVIRIFSYKNK